MKMQSKTGYEPIGMCEVTMLEVIRWFLCQLISSSAFLDRKKDNLAGLL